jgi:hypothetical protein
MTLTELTINPGKHTLLAVDISGGQPTGFFFADVTLTLTGSTAFVVSKDRNAGEGEAYTRQPDGTWLGDQGGTVMLCARV